MPEHKLMKAVMINEFGGRDKLMLSEFPTPAPSEGEVLVRVHAAGVNPVDWKIREGRLKDRFSHQFPIILGWDMAGVVVETGHSARRFKAGDEVFAYCRRPVIQSGTYAEYVALPESYIAAGPRGLSFEEAASMPLAGLTAYQAIYSAARIKPGESILIIGASGGVGGFAVQFARIAGAAVYAVASQANHAYLKELGADETIDYRETDFCEAVRDYEPQGVDVVFDLIGGEALRRGADCVKTRGRLVSILENAGEQFPHVDFHYVFVEPNVVQLAHISELIAAGKMKTHVSAVYPLEDVRQAHAQMETGHTRGKIVLSI
jgi:NADPH:quinone reductase-like Zn-dependent oxidoreductase